MLFEQVEQSRFYFFIGEAGAIDVSAFSSSTFSVAKCGNNQFIVRHICSSI